MDVDMLQEVPASAEFPQTFEVLEIIFMHLPGELNGLKEVCQRFNQVITQSVPLMKRCQLQWNHTSEKHFRSKERKFCNVRFSDLWKEDVPHFKQFVQQHHLTLTKIELEDDSVLTAKELHGFLSLVAGTVKDFKLLSSWQSSAETPRLVLPKLESLALGHEAVNFFDYTGTDPKLSMPKLRKLEYIDWEDTSFIYEDDFGPEEEAAATMIEFLRNSDHLESLKVQSCLAKKVLTEFIRSPFNFQLKELALEMYGPIFAREDINGDNLRQFSTPNLPTFLTSQFNSLTTLKIKNAVLRSSDYNAMFRLRIKHLEIDCCWFDDDEDEDDEEPENQTIEKFVFRRFRDDDQDNDGYVRDESKIRGAISDVLSSCARLRSVEFHNTRLFLNCAVLMTMKKFLTNLTLGRCKDLFPLRFPSLKKLKVVEDEQQHTTRELEELMHLIILNPQLRKITVPAAFESDAAFGLIREAFDYVIEYK